MARLRGRPHGDHLGHAPIVVRLEVRAVDLSGAVEVVAQRVEGFLHKNTPCMGKCWKSLSCNYVTRESVAYAAPRKKTFTATEPVAYKA